MILRLSHSLRRRLFNLVRSQPRLQRVQRLRIRHLQINLRARLIFRQLREDLHLQLRSSSRSELLSEELYRLFNLDGESWILQLIARHFITTTSSRNLKPAWYSPEQRSSLPGTVESI